MPFERWGSLSVDDHVDTKALVANVLLYDRLVIPEWTDQDDRREREYWEDKGWNPSLQTERLQQLGDLAIRRPWTKALRQQFQTRMAQVAAEQYDADPKHVTRMLLAQQQVIEKPPGIHGVKVIPAYNSEAAMQQDIAVAPADHLAAQAFLLSRRMAMPDLPDEVALAKAIELSRDPDFRQRRADLFDWQQGQLAAGWSPKDAVERMVERVDRYNEKVQDAAGKVYWKLAFTVVSVGVGFLAGGIGVAAVSGGISFLQFLKLDAKPEIDAGSAEPVAMFHDVENRLGIKLL